MLLYCVKCKQKTESKDISGIITKNNRNMLKSTCSVCEGKKSTFVKKDKSGKGFTDAIGKYIGECIYQLIKERMFQMILLIIEKIIRIVILVQNVNKG